MGAAVRDYVPGNPVEPNDVGNKEFSSFRGTGEFGEGHVVDRLGEAVNNGKDSVKTPGHW